MKNSCSCRFAKFLIFICFVMLLGCSSSGGNDRKTNFRVLNAVPDAQSLDFYIDSKPFLTSVRYLESSGYIDVDVGSHDIQVNVTNSFTPLKQTSITFNDAVDYSLLIFGPSNDSASLFLRDNNDPAPKESVKIRLINVAHSSRSVDAYILSPSSDISSVPASKESLNYRQASNYLTSAVGNYVISITEKNSKKIIAQSPVQAFESKSVYTALLADAEGGSTPPRLILLKDR